MKRLDKRARVCTGAGLFLLMLAVVMPGVVFAAVEPVQTNTEAGVTVSPEGCAIEKFTVPSKSMGRAIRAVVVLPPAYARDDGARYPVLYALHGMGAPYGTWADMRMLRATLKEHPMLLVCFDGDKASWYLDATRKPDSQFTTFFFDELIPYIDSHYRTRADGRSRGVTGFSMGGYGAFHYMLTHPDRFASVSSLSAAFSYMGEWGTPPHPSVEALLGPYAQNKEDYLKCGIRNRMEALLSQGKSLPPLFMHCGTEDTLVAHGRTFRDFLNAQNEKLVKEGRPALVFEVKESPGKHNWAFWHGASAEIADFHWKSFEQAAGKGR